MPYFVFQGRDRVGKSQVRAQIRDEHRSYIRLDQPGCRCVAGGPLMSADGLSMTGTLLVFEATDHGAVERFMLGDPYSRANIFAQTSVDRWNWGWGTDALYFG